MKSIGLVMNAFKLADRRLPSSVVLQSYRYCGKINSNCNKTAQCWNCEHTVECTKQFFCEKCDHIQPMGKQNLFEYLNLKTSFTVDENILKKRFRDLQFKLHPDKFAKATEEEKKMSDEHSRNLNRAFKTLSEPLARARYLLEILGEKDTKADLSPEELMDMMEWNERVTDMGVIALEKEMKVVQESIRNCLSELSSAFADKDIKMVKEKVTQLSYLYSLRNNIETRLEKETG